MARRAIRVVDVVEILVHWHAGRRIGELCSSLRVDPKTVRKLYRGAGSLGPSRRPLCIPVIPDTPSG